MDISLKRPTDLSNKSVRIFEYFHCDPISANKDPSVRAQPWAEMPQSPLQSAPQHSSCTSDFLLPPASPAHQGSVLILQTANPSNCTPDPTPATENKTHTWMLETVWKFLYLFLLPLSPLLINISSGKCLLGSSATRPTSGKMGIHVLPWLTSSPAMGLQ